MKGWGVDYDMIDVECN